MNAIVRRCLENGVIVLTAGTYGNVIRLLPPLTIDDALLEDGLNVLDDAIGAAVGYADDRRREPTPVANVRA